MIPQRLAVFSLALLAIGTPAQPTKDVQEPTGGFKTKIAGLDETWANLHLHAARCDVGNNEKLEVMTELTGSLEEVLVARTEAQETLVDMLNTLRTQLMEGTEADYCWGAASANRFGLKTTWSSAPEEMFRLKTTWSSAPEEIVTTQMPFMALFVAMQNVKAELAINELKANKMHELQVEVKTIADCLPRGSWLARLWGGERGETQTWRARIANVQRAVEDIEIVWRCGPGYTELVARNDGMQRVVQDLTNGLTQRKGVDMPAAELPATVDMKGAEDLLMFMAQVLQVHVQYTGQCYTGEVTPWPLLAMQAAANYTLTAYELDLARTWCALRRDDMKPSFFR